MSLWSSTTSASNVSCSFLCFQVSCEIACFEVTKGELLSECLCKPAWTRPVHVNCIYVVATVSLQTNIFSICHSGSSKLSLRFYQRWRRCCNFRHYWSFIYMDTVQPMVTLEVGCDVLKVGEKSTQKSTQKRNSIEKYWKKHSKTVLKFNSTKKSTL